MKICFILLASIFLGIFMSMFIREISQWFSFLVGSLSDFGFRVMLAFKNDLRSTLSLLIPLKSLRSIGSRYPEVL